VAVISSASVEYLGRNICFICLHPNIVYWDEVSDMGPGEAKSGNAPQILRNDPGTSRKA